MEKLAAAQLMQFTTMSIERLLAGLITAICVTECSRTTVVVTMEKLAAAQQKQFTTMSIELSLAGLTLEPPRWVNLPLFDF